MITKSNFINIMNNSLKYSVIVCVNIIVVMSLFLVSCKNVDFKKIAPNVKIKSVKTKQVISADKNKKKAKSKAKSKAKVKAISSNTKVGKTKNKSKGKVSTKSTKFGKQKVKKSSRSSKKQNKKIKLKKELESSLVSRVVGGAKSSGTFTSQNKLYVSLPNVGNIDIQVGDIVMKELGSGKIASFFTFRDFFKNNSSISSGMKMKLLKIIEEEIVFKSSVSNSDVVLKSNEIRDVSYLLDSKKSELLKDYVFWNRPKFNLKMEIHREESEREKIEEFFNKIYTSSKFILTVDRKIKLKFKKVLKKISESLLAGNKLFIVQKVIYTNVINASFMPKIENDEDNQGYKALKLIAKTMIPQSQSLNYTTDKSSGRLIMTRSPKLYWGYDLLELEPVGGIPGFKVKEDEQELE